MLALQEISTARTNIFDFLSTVKRHSPCNRGKDHEETFSKVVEKAGRSRESVSLLVGYVCQTPVQHLSPFTVEQKQRKKDKKGNSPLIIGVFFYSSKDVNRRHVDSCCTYSKDHVKTVNTNTP